MAMPNFILIGAAKSGTTSLFYYLNQHPQIYMSRNKEPHFFAFEGTKRDIHGPQDFARTHRALITDIVLYRALLKEDTIQKVLGRDQHCVVNIYNQWVAFLNIPTVLIVLRSWIL